MQMKADTKAAKRDIDNYFDRMKQAVETMNAEEHKKQAGVYARAHSCMYVRLGVQ